MTSVGLTPVRKARLQVADHGALAAAEDQRVAADPPEERGPAHGDEALDHDGQHVLAAHQSAVEERQSRGHQHHEAGRNQHETGIAGIKDVRHNFPPV